MSDYINAPPVRELWTLALRSMGDVKNGDYLPLGRLQAAFFLEQGRKLQDVLAAGERDGLLAIDRGSVPTTYRATFILERAARELSEDWTD